MVEFDPYSHAVHDDPYPHYKALRDEAPAYFNEKYGFWLLSRYDDVQGALRDFRRFSNSEGVSLEAQMQAGYPMVLTMDPPRHTKVRKIVQQMLTPQHVARLEPSVRELAVELLTPFEGKGGIDILSDFAVYLPMAVIARMIKVPRSDEDRVRVLTDKLVSRGDGEFGISDETARAYMELAQYFEELVGKHRDDAPDDSLLSAILEAEKRGDLSHEEVIGFLMLLGVAGNETTTKLIGNMAYRLWQNKDQRQLLVDDPSLIGKAVEETVRFDGSTQLLGRTAMEDIELHGKTIKKGQRIGLLMISANRDERKWERPDEFDIMRKTAGHCGFGFGIHACIGAALARLEVRVAFEEILRRFPDYEVVESGMQRMHSPNVRGYTHLPLTFRAAV